MEKKQHPVKESKENRLKKNTSEKEELTMKADKTNKKDRTDKEEKIDKTDKMENNDKKDKVEKTDKAEKIDNKDKKEKKIKSKLEPEPEPEPEPESTQDKTDSSNNDSFFVEPIVVEKKEEIIVPKQHLNLKIIEFDDIPPFTPIQITTFFKYVNSQYLKRGDPNLDRDISENFSKYLSESGSIGVILKKKNILDMISFLIFLNDAFKKNLTENYGKIIIVLLRTLFPEIKSILTIKEEKEILAEFMKYNIEINNKQIAQSVGEVTYQILKKFKAFLELELDKSKSENDQGNEINVIGLERSFKIFEPYFIRINAIYEYSNFLPKVYEIIKEPTMQSSDSSSSFQCESEEADENNKKTESQKNKKVKQNNDIKERGEDNDKQKNVKKSVEEEPGKDSVKDFGLSLDEKKKEKSVKLKQIYEPDQNIGKNEKSDEVEKTRSQISKNGIKYSLQMLKERTQNSDKGIISKTPKTDINEHDRKQRKNMGSKQTFDESVVIMKDTELDKAKKRAKSSIYKEEREDSPLIEEKEAQSKKRSSLILKNAQKDNKKYHMNEKEMH